MDETSTHDDNAVSKYANTQRKSRRSGYGEGTVYEYERKLASGEIWRGYRAKRSIKHGERIVRVTGQGTTRSQALDRLEKAITRKRIAFGELPQSHLKLTEDDEIKTIAHCFEIWLDRQKAQIRLNSWKVYSAKVRLYLLPAFGTTPIRLLTSDALETYFEVTLPQIKSKTGEPLGETSIRTAYWTMNAMLEYALKRQWIDRNPLRSVEPPKRRKVTLDEERELQKAARWTAKHTIEKLQDREDEARWLLAFIGLRQSEALGLRLSSIKPKRSGKPAMLLIDKQLVYETADHGCGYDTKGKWACGRSSEKCPQREGEAGFRLAEELKTAEGHRALPLTDRMYAVIKAQATKQTTLQKSEAYEPLEGLDNLLFSDAAGKPVRHQDDRAAWKKMLKDFEINYDLRLHHARHFAATMLLEAKASTTEMQKILGWSSRSVEMMKQTYTHADNAVLLKDSMHNLDAALYMRVDATDSM